MDALSEMIVIIAMIFLWTIELASAIINRDPIIAALSLLLLIIWIDELRPIKKDFSPGFNSKIFVTALILLLQQILRFFL